MQLGQKRIAFIHNKFPIGGAERVTIDIADCLSTCGYETIIFTGKYEPEKLPQNIPHHFKVIELSEVDVSNSKADTVELIKYINDMDIKILVSVVIELKYIQMILDNTACKYVFAHHGSPFWESQIKVDNARKRRDKSLGSYLEWLFLSYPKYHILKTHKRRFYKLYHSSYAKTDRYTVLCDDYKNELVKCMGLDAKTNKIRVISNMERKVEKVNLNKMKQILFVGRLSYSDKRVDRLIDIWEKVYSKAPDWELIIVGDGEERKNLETRSRNVNLERITFAGSSSNVQPYYDQASILCLTSTFEGWPLCLTEAQANGVVPIAFNCTAGIQHILGPSGTNGFLIPCFDIQAFANKLLGLMKDEALLAQMRMNVLAKSEEYSTEVVGEKWRNLFEELLQQS